MHIQLMIMADSDGNYPHKNVPGSSLGPPHELGFEVSDYFEFNEWIEEDPLYSVGGYNPQNPSYTPNEAVVDSTGISISSNNSSFHEAGTVLNKDGGSGREMREKVAFKTKSEIEVLDDGFKWRKYGKKMVKNSPNPRNYYRCSVEGCPVKKRVERDKEDPHYVVTTYEGIHNHQL